MLDSGKTAKLKELRKRFVPQGPYNTVPYFIESARGATVYDVEGRALIDFSGGIGVLNVGHCHPKVVRAVKDQADKFLHSCFHVLMYESYLKLAQKLCDLTPGSFPKMAMFANSGAEAVENAVKIARHFTRRPAIIVFAHCFHGRTLLTMTMTSKIHPYKLGFGPFAPEVYRMPYAYCYRCPLGLRHPACHLACAEYLKEFFINYVAAESTAAVVVEPIAGEGGFITPPPGYFSKLMEICNEHGILFIADEIQTGMGRTGKMFAMEHWQVEPDMVTIAKSLAAGMPLSAVVGKKEILDAPHVGGLGGTFGGNPVSCRAALAVLEVFEEENLLQKAERLGAKLKSRLESWMQRFEIIGDVRGKGIMLALELVKDRETKEPAVDETKALVKFCYERGLILLSCGNFGNVIRLLMPFVIEEQQLESGLAIMEEGLSCLSKQNT
ncbi:MAG: 4-aminobutyrate--2-oxoglutarate transaminase [Thermodesulfobacteriota bacterium]